MQSGKLTQAEADALESALSRLVATTEHDPNGMGETYQFLAITSDAVAPPYPFGLDLSKLSADSG